MHDCLASGAFISAYSLNGRIQDLRCCRYTENANALCLGFLQTWGALQSFSGDDSIMFSRISSRQCACSCCARISAFPAKKMRKKAISSLPRNAQASVPHPLPGNILPKLKPSVPLTSKKGTSTTKHANF